LDGSAILRASAVAKRRGIDSSCFIFLLVLLARGVCSSLRPSTLPSWRGKRERCSAVKSGRHYYKSRNN
jgi:hypothetical protein